MVEQAQTRSHAFMAPDGGGGIIDIRPIVAAEDYDHALRLIETLWGVDPDSPDGRALDMLATLVDTYESKHFPVDAADSVDVLETHMEMTGRSQRDLAALLGSDSRASEILNRRRALTMEMAQKLYRQWGIPAAALIDPYELAGA